ncbi:protein c9orf32 [Cystoisospora suis]|uniref:Alpha N-terminal protein methyltransferase 1 n=1 Tax=Cystoisospora suis TaxID=483139 RepID=A0A2C6KQG3_9APIC|nr:protein c9orf32 [Cystoisospora suis]
MEKFLSEARNYVKSERLKDLYQTPLQNFTPEKTYDCFWLQWSILYLTDADLVDLLKRCSACLNPSGVICVKENVSGEGSGFMIDKTDNSIMRTDQQYRDLFKKANLRLLFDMKQPNFPKSLYPVYMYCLRPLAK